MKVARVKFDKLPVIIFFFVILLVIYITKIEDVDISMFERFIKLIIMDLQEDVRRFIYTIDRFLQAELGLIG